MPTIVIITGGEKAWEDFMVHIMLKTTLHGYAETEHTTTTIKERERGRDQEL